MKEPMVRAGKATTTSDHYRALNVSNTLRNHMFFSISQTPRPLPTFTNCDFYHIYT